MKISRKTVSIVTWLGNGNFGTSLQSYALHEKLALMGYDVNYLRPFEKKFGLKDYVKYIFDILGLSRIGHKFKKKSKPLKFQKVNDFHHAKYNLKKIRTPWQYRKLLEETDAFLTGSDQIWNTYHRYHPFMFLDFAGDVKRIAYASSIGTSHVPDQYRAKIRHHLSLFKKIGVRERTALSILSEITGRNDIVQVVDPTFLLSPEDWIALGKEAVLEFIVPDRYILCYLIGENSWYEKQLEDVKTKTGIDNIIIIPAVENLNINVNGTFVYRDAGPVEFVELIRRATLICTDSFHATALSINLSKDFVEFLRFRDIEKESQNSRIYDLLDHYHLRSRLYSAESDEWNVRIEYPSVQAILEEDRKFSLNFLMDAIDK